MPGLGLLFLREMNVQKNMKYLISFEPDIENKSKYRKYRKKLCQKVFHSNKDSVMFSHVKFLHKRMCNIKKTHNSGIYFIRFH